MKNLFAASLIMLSTAAFAGDAAKLTHLGFSQDGKSYAFMQSGVQDGSGFSYAEIKFLDTASNRYSSPSIEVQQSDDENEIPLSVMESMAVSKASAKLKELGISPENKGDVVISRKITDMDTRELKEATFSNGLIIGGFHASQYKVKMSLTKAKTGPETACIVESEAKKLKLELVNLETKKSVILQNDKKLPSSRGCAHNYEIEDVVVINPDYSQFNAKVVVLIRVFTYGFEGEDVRYMAVSGNLN